VINLIIWIRDIVCHSDDGVVGCVIAAGSSWAVGGGRVASRHIGSDRASRSASMEKLLVWWCWIAEHGIDWKGWRTRAGWKEACWARASSHGSGSD
jgi:hypothetical protein